MIASNSSLGISLYGIERLSNIMTPFWIGYAEWQEVHSRPPSFFINVPELRHLGQRNIVAIAVDGSFILMARNSDR
jgi:hypothetical protein